MTLVVRSRRGRVEDPGLIDGIISLLQNRGFKPLILDAKQGYYAAFGSPFSKTSSQSIPSSRYRNILTIPSRDLGSASGGYLEPVGGDAFPSSKGQGLLYVLIAEFQLFSRQPGPSEPPFQLEVGFLGDDGEVDDFSSFFQNVEAALSSLKKKVKWLESEPSNPQFLRLTKEEGTKFITGQKVSNEDIELARILLDQPTRELSLVVKRAGGMLRVDMKRKSGGSQEEQSNLIEALLKSNLLAREYVIICRQTSNQINRVKSREVIDRLREHGVLCSCGRQISDERIEELFTPTDLLRRMLGQSFWMTALLVDSFLQFGISKDRMLMNLQDGPEEIDCFVDLDGTLLMFELKDSEFSMGHAYPFSGRIGIYKPDYAIVVSANGIAPEVKSYLGKVGPGAEIRYVESLFGLKNHIGELLTEVRSKKVRSVLEQLESATFVGVPLLSILSSKIGVKMPPPSPRDYLE